MIKIRKNTARKLFNNGKELILMPCKCHWGAVGLMGIAISKNYITHADFDSLVNAFEYYNCNSQLGNYTAFYFLGEGANE